MPTLTSPTRTILHLSDTHILPTAHDRLHGVDTMANLRLALDNVEAHGARPDAIVISGDLANGGELESYQRLPGVLCFAAPATAYTVDPLAGESSIRGIDGSAFGLLHLYGRTAVASAVAVSADPRPLYVHQVSADVLRRWTVPAPVAV
jgi:hypothetical protein